MLGTFCGESNRDECGNRWSRMCNFFWWCSFVVAVGTLALMLYGEHHYAEEVHALTPLMRGYVPSPCSPLPVNDRKLVHIDCPLAELDTFYPPSSFSANVAKFTGVFFETKAEIFQHVQKGGTLGPFIEGDWVDHQVDLSQLPSMVMPGDTNPDFFPAVPGRGRVFTSKLKAGGFTLPSHLLTKFKKKQLLPLVDDGYYQPSESRPPTHLDYKNTQVKNNALYSGDPEHPRIGDVRVTFWGSTATHVSVIGLQTTGFLGSDRHIQGIPSPTLQNRTMSIFAEGDYSPAALVAEYVSETHASNTQTWLLRCASFLLVWFVLFVTVVTCNTSKTCCVVFLNSGLFALSIITGLAGLVWWRFDIVVATSLWVISSVAVVLAVVAWMWDSNTNGSRGSNRRQSGNSTSSAASSVYAASGRWTNEHAPRGYLNRALLAKNEESDGAAGASDEHLQNS
ncbi:UNVERIFIED_CONTAM: hypothetical protein HHA_266090 [Hammondia hammondi]|eukprot:XP_008888250.1 hypothetical protein HHA_266090 [Hammondia hammondi]